MIENPETGALESFNFDQLLKHVPELKRFNCHISTYQFNPPIDSSDMEPELWAKIVKIISSHYNDYDGFVILHGTDTMAYTACALSFMLENLSKPVILTGSQLPIGMLRTDGKENLITAIEIAAARRPDGTPMVPEVCIFFENELMRGNRTTKINAENFNAFRSFNYPPLAKVGIHIRYEEHLIRRPDPSRPMKPHYLFDTNVVVLTLFPVFVKVSSAPSSTYQVSKPWYSRLSDRAMHHKRMVDPPTQRSKRTRHRHRQHHSMSTGSRRNATLRYRSSTAPNRCYQWLRQHTRMCCHQTDVPSGARPEPTGNTPSHGLKSGRRNYKRIISPTLLELLPFTRT